MGNPREEEAQIKYAEKNYNYHSKAKKYFNAETTAIRNKQRAITGLGRRWSTIDANALQIQAKGRKYLETAQANYYKGQPIDEGGRSRAFGRNKYLDLLKAQSAVESRLHDEFGRKRATLMQGELRQYQHRLAKNSEQLYAQLPEWGAPVLYRKMSLFEKIQPILSLTSSLMGIGASAKTLFD